MTRTFSNVANPIRKVKTIYLITLENLLIPDFDGLSNSFNFPTKKSLSAAPIVIVGPQLPNESKAHCGPSGCHNKPYRSQRFLFWQKIQTA